MVYKTLLVASALAVAHAQYTNESSALGVDAEFIGTVYLMGFELTKVNKEMMKQLL